MGVSKITIIVFTCGFFLLGSAAFAQNRFGQLVSKGDLAFGFGTIEAPSSSSASSGYSPQTMGGGLYPSSVLISCCITSLGVSGEMSWRASQNIYEGYEPFRPILLTSTESGAPRLNKKVGAEVTAAIGAETLRFILVNTPAISSLAPIYVSSNHFGGHFGGGIKIYVHGNFFIRPEANFYLIHNNNEFSAGYGTRVGASIGYSF